MAIELRVEIAIVDTEPDNPGNQGYILHSGKITTLVSEVADYEGILDIAKVRLDDTVDEVRVDMKDQLDTVKRQ